MIRKPAQVAWDRYEVFTVPEPGHAVQIDGEVYRVSHKLINVEDGMAYVQLEEVMEEQGSGAGSPPPNTQARQQGKHRGK
jgi:hypothetical protein